VAVEAELARLRAENARLLKLLKLSPHQAAPPGPAQAAFFEAAPGIVHHLSPQDAKVAFFGALFAARTDVYALRYDNQRTGKSGWVPAVGTHRHYHTGSARDAGDVRLFRSVRNVERVLTGAQHPQDCAGHVLRVVHHLARPGCDA
jgi:hypothetical protein